MTGVPGPVDDVVDARMDDYLDALYELLRAPTVSSTGDDFADGAALVGRFLE